MNGGRSRTDLMKLQLRTCGPKLWNSIDTAIINNSKNLHAFKNKYKKHLLLYYV